jgi:hypothetical protein
MSDNKVCPYCGNDWFRVYQCMPVLVNLTTNEWRPQVDPNAPIQYPSCANCERRIEAFVTEQFFHEVICDPNFDDTAVIVIQQDKAKDIIGFLRGTKPLKDYTLPNMVGFYEEELLGGEYRTSIEVLQTGKQYIIVAVYWKSSEGKWETVNTRATRLLGKHEIEADGKKFQIIVITSEGYISDDECITNVTSGNTDGNE